MARTTDNEHSGHRERMRKKFIENGFDVFETHEALEMFLYYAIPRKDTNPLAHRLLTVISLPAECVTLRLTSL